MLMPIKVNIEVAIIDSRKKIFNYCFVILIVQSKHWVVHSSRLPDNCAIVTLRFQSLVNPLQHFVPSFYKGLIALTS